jgi:hypothetical protein
MSINWGQAQPAPLEFWRIVHSAFPLTRNLGIYNPGHDDHGDGRALDIGLLVSRPNENEIAWGLINDVLLPNLSEIGWSYFIYDQWIWYPDARGQQRGGFQGDHTNHNHVSWSQADSQTNSFPQAEQAIHQLLMDITGGVEDDDTQSSYVGPYCS